MKFKTRKASDHLWTAYKHTTKGHTFLTQNGKNTPCMLTMHGDAPAVFNLQHTHLSFPDGNVAKGW